MPYFVYDFRTKNKKIEGKMQDLRTMPVYIAFIIFGFSMGYALTATKWSDFKIDKNNKTSATGVTINLGEITLEENSILNLVTGTSPKLDDQFFDGDLIFKGAKLLEINVDIQNANNQGETSIYRIASKIQNGDLYGVANSFVCGVGPGFEGICSINLNLDATKKSVHRLFYVNTGTLTIDQNMNIKLTPHGKVKTIFYNAGTLEFDGRFFVDLREQEGMFTDSKIDGTRKVVIEHYGAKTAINTYKKAFPVQIYGDIISAGQRLELNLVTEDSIFDGRFDIGDSPHYFSYNNVELANGANANIDLTFLQATNDAPQRFALNMSDKSTAKINALFDRTHYALLDFSVMDSVLYANLSYSQASTQRGVKDTVRIALSNNGTWISTQSGYADEIYFNVMLPEQPKPTIPANKIAFGNIPLKRMGGGGVVDLRYADFEGNLRSFSQFDTNNRIVLNSNLISGNNGTFRLYGILNRDLWDKDAQGNSIATDQIITQSVVGNHSIEIYWDAKNVDESLLSEDLVGDRIVVAKQLSTKNEGNFIGGTTPIGLYEYTPNLTKENLLDNAGNHIGYEWVIGKLTQGSPTPPPISSRPSFLSKTLNTLFSIPYKTFLTQTQTLHQRMGDLRYFDSIAGAYFKTNYSFLYDSSSPTNISAFTHSEDMLLGADVGVYGFGGKHFFGASLNFTPIQDSGEDGAYSGNSLAYGISIYATSLFNGGFYTDVLLKYAYASHQYDLHSQDFLSEALDFDSHYLISSFEMGYKMKLPIKTPNFDYSFYYLKPQFNLDFGVIFGSDMMRLHHSGGYDVGAKYDLSLPIKPSLSLDFGRRFDNQQILGDVFVTLGAEYGFNAGNTLELSTPYNDGTFSPEGILNLKLGVGANVMLMSGARFYFDLSSKFLGRIAPVLSISAGARIPIGSKHQRSLYRSPQSPVIYGSARENNQN